MFVVQNWICSLKSCKFCLLAKPVQLTMGQDLIHLTTINSTNTNDCEDFFRVKTIFLRNLSLQNLF